MYIGCSDARDEEMYIGCSDARGKKIYIGILLRATKGYVPLMSSVLSVSFRAKRGICFMPNSEADSSLRSE
jgi:hypothetical protein